MGRALKIQKTNPGAGNGGTSVDVDQGFPNFESRTNPVYNSPVQTLNSTQFLGVVGGSPATSTASSAFPEILCSVNILLADGASTTAGAGRIIRQKGSHKFLVVYTASTVAAGDFITGQSYQIAVLGTTNWTSVGAGNEINTVGDVFTATAAGDGSGTAYSVGICVLSNTGSPTAGNMSIRYSTGDSTAVYASYITNKWVRDWTGMTFATYSDSNAGENIQSGENQYVANFFTDEGTVIESGTAQNTIQLAQVASVTV